MTGDAHTRLHPSMNCYTWFSKRSLTILPAFILLLLATTSVFAQSDAERFYYYQGARIPLQVNPRLVAVKFAPDISASAQRALTEGANAFENFDARVDAPVGGIVWLPVRAGQNSIVASERLNAQPGVEFASPVYDAGAMQLAETDEFLARFKSANASEIESINQRLGASILEPLAHSDRVYILKPQADNPRSARELANAYVEAGVVEFAEPNFVLRETKARAAASNPTQTEAFIPTDANFDLQWGLQNTRQFQGAVSGADINAVRAWDVTQGASSIVIAVIDEGVDASHPDLAGKVLTGYNSLLNNSNTMPQSDDIHGTAVAGVAAANSNNGSGIAGVCWFCKILPIKVAERDPNGDWTATIGSLSSGIDWAWQHGADVLNNSWTMANPSDSVELSIINARFGGRGNKGSTVIFASGNENAGTVSFPASRNAYVIAVGASNWCDQRKTAVNNSCNNNNASWGSNYGSALDVVAPGEAIYTLCNANQCAGTSSYVYQSGTSLAAPFVSGTVGLLYSLNPSLTPAQVQDVLQTGAKNLGVAGRDDETGYGRIDAQKSIRRLYNLNLSVTDHKILARPGETVTYTLQYANTGSTAMGSTVISVTLPAHTNYVNSSPAFSPQGGGIYKLNLGTLAANATGSATFRVQVQPDGAGQEIIFDASISGAFPEASAKDNAARDSTRGMQAQIYLPFIVH